ncbi:glycosyltransferase family 2 protein [Bacillus sp. FJAT-27445]|uniref:glycosyltransferase family 2 protein n=1 Tax=Bacillus sp. FJAT-27445 TaxID=1679166 RepID=UPI00074454F7|nr:glycosyltransferase family 2 protein [Bacillus sp. FJAT-27445]
MLYNPKVSIITPTYNQEKLIGDCIKSVINQTYIYWEMIIIDDGSTDNTKGVIEQYLYDPRIKYIYQDNKGPNFLAENYNKALNCASGELIAILEGDDYWPKEKLEKQVPAFQNNEIVLSYGDYIITDIKGKLELPHRLGHLPENIRHNTPVGTASLFMLRGEGATFTYPVTVVIRKETLLEIGGFLQCTYAPLVDYSTFLHLGLKGKFHYAEGVVGFWRRRITSITSTKRLFIYEGVRRYGKEFFDLNKELSLFKNSNWNDIEKSWKKGINRAYIEKGRMELLKGDWDSARKSFTKLLNSPRTFLKGIIGIIAAILKKDVERIFKMKNGYSLLDFKED